MCVKCSRLQKQLNILIFLQFTGELSPLIGTLRYFGNVLNPDMFVNILVKEHEWTTSD